MEKSDKVSAARKRRSTGQKPGGRDEVPPVGRVLRRAREHHGLSIREVERRIGRSSAYLSQIERGLIRQPDPVVLLELAEVYKLDFMSLAAWAGWMGEKHQEDRGNTASLLVRRVLELDDTQRAQVLSYVETLLRERRG